MILTFQQVGFINAGLYVTSLLKILHFYAIFLIFVGGMVEAIGERIFICEMGIWVYLKLF